MGQAHDGVIEWCTGGVCVMIQGDDRVSEMTG